MNWKGNYTITHHLLFIIILAVVFVLVIPHVGQVVPPSNAINSKIEFLVQVLIFVACSEDVSF